MKSKIRIIGIDPGSRITGVGIIESNQNQLKYIYSSEIKTTPKASLAFKLQEIFSHLTEIINKYSPDVSALEKIFHAKNAHSSLILGHARGVAMLALVKYNLEVFEYSATQIKSAVSGAGQASKDQINSMVMVLLNLNRNQKLPLDESDALAASICYANSCRINQLL